ncbi:glutathione S-transferase [Coniochaeta sp. 2T2.1]|nr:glutathione S-transferase [Coniochaeta sp. 2T2.1]
MTSTAPPEKRPKPGLKIYGFVAVNPYKLTIYAEELGIPYNYIQLDLVADEPHAEWYTAINPNGKMLWLQWQVAGYGPMMGQGTHFARYAVESVPYGNWRYHAECTRLNTVLDKQLTTNKYVAGDTPTIADFAVFTYAHSARWCEIDMSDFPNVKAWIARLLQRPRIQKALQVPVLLYPFHDEAVMSAEHEDFYRMIRKAGSKLIWEAHEGWAGEVAGVPSDFANLETSGMTEAGREKHG